MSRSSSFSPSRSRRLATVASVLTIVTLAAGALTLVAGVSLPEAWWPRTGAAFAAESPAARQDPCGLIVGPAKVYCDTGTATSAADQDSRVGWKVVPAGAVLAALVMWRHRSAAGQRRR
ncbi:hypothetical protein ACF08N_35575 [Streptomyces sp. NPDC015127]|uniref:hypothetical protein n=1 Tax=Streptomyces sp. NPDC015127 TaxID=3364939 RepID=UPI0036FE0EEB